MRKTLFSIATLGLLGFCSPAVAMRLDVPQMLMHQAYGNYNPALDCWETTGGQMTNRYCMKPMAVETVKVQGIPVSFLLVTGHEIDGPSPQQDDTAGILKQMKAVSATAKKSASSQRAATADTANEEGLPPVEVIPPPSADSQDAPAPESAEKPTESSQADAQNADAETVVETPQAQDQTSLIGMFVYTGSTDQDYQLIAQLPRKDIENPDEAKQGHFMRMGPNRYGWMFDSGYTANGYTERWVTVYTPVLGIVKDIAKIQVYSDDSGAVSDSSKATVFDGVPSFDSSRVYDGFYALSVKMKRQFEGKELPTESYEFRFNKRQSQFVAPKDYPLMPE